MAHLLGRRRRFWTPLTISVLYLAVGGFWIVAGDLLAFQLVTDPDEHMRLHGFLTWLYVLGTAALLAALIRRAMHPLQRSERNLIAIIESLTDAVLVVDDREQVIDANRAALSLLGLPDKAELLIPIAEFGRRFDVRRSDGVAVPPQEYATHRALLDREVVRYEGLLRRANGEEIEVEIGSAPVERDEGEKHTRMAVTIIRDVTELKRLARLRDEFLSVAAHELKTPVATVKGYAQLLRRQAPPEPAVPALEVINRQCDRMNRLVQDLLELSRLNLNLMRMRLQTCDVGEIAQEAVQRMEVLGRKHRLSIVRDGAAPVRGDCARLDQVLVNLIDNAMKFSPDGGEVTVHVGRVGGDVRVAVEDRGIGIPAERQAQIFERFYQAHAGMLHSAGGMGLGLYLSREIVTRHGGRIWFESDPGVGSTFYFSLPAAEEAAVRDEAAAHTQ